MNQPIDSDLERLSAFMDGEVVAEELEQVVEQLLATPEAQQHWANWHQISDGLHERTLDDLPVQFHQGVADRLASEPVYMTKRRRSPRLPQWLPLKEMAGMAVAASVTAIAILGFQQLHGPEGGALQVAAIEEQPATEAVSSGRSTGTLKLVAGNFPVAPLAEVDQALEAYLVNHQHLGGAASPVVSPYIRFIGHQAGTP